MGFYQLARALQVHWFQIVSTDRRTVRTRVWYNQAVSVVNQSDIFTFTLRALSLS